MRNATGTDRVVAAGSGAARSAYLDDMLALLWPPAGQADEPARVVLPSRRAPRVLVPVRPRRAGMSAVLRYTAQQKAADRILGAALAGAVGAGLCRVLPPVSNLVIGRPSELVETARSVDEQLGAVFGEPVTSALALTARRPNRKPVLQVFDRVGRTIAFAKVGISPYTDALVTAEADALRVLAAADLRHAVVPQLLAVSEWHGHPLTVQSALPRMPHRRDRSALLERAMVEISGVTSGNAAAGAAEFASELRRLPGTFAAEAPADLASEWRELVEAALAARGPGTEFGAWHGDWTIWNCAVGPASVGIWDWERFATPVPPGFDRLHFVLNSRVGPHRDRYRQAADGLVAEAEALLAPWQLAAAEARAVVAFYLLTLSARFLATSARQAQSARVEEWAYPAVRSALGIPQRTCARRGDSAR